MTATKTKVLICPYCGDTQPAAERCRVCGGLFEPLSRQASHNAMGPWFVRDEKRPFQPGASYETLVKLIERGQVTRYSIIRGPTTKQFWTAARRVPGLAHLLGYCHNCDATVTKDDHGCPVCGVPFGAYLDRNYLGLPEVKPLPWEAAPEDRGGAAQPRPAPVADFRRAAEPLGISSFASDDELRGMSSRPPYVPPAAAMPAVVGGVTDEAFDDDQALAVHATSGAMRSNGGVAWRGSNVDSGPITPDRRPGTLLSTSPADLSARLAQRRVQQQKQTIRLLMIALGVVTVLASIAIAVMIVKMAGTQSAAGPADKPAAVKQGSNGANAATTKRDAPAEAAQPLETNEPAATLPAADLEIPAVEGDATPHAADHERAVALLIEARKENRELKERIHDCEQAVALLKNIKAKAPANEQPATLSQEIAEAEKLLERLKLQEFFP